MNHPPSDDLLVHYVDALLDSVPREPTRAEEDPVTGLPNRNALLATLDARRMSGEPTAVALLGLDNFRSIIVTLGHGTAETVLQVVAARLLARLPDDVYLSRLDGDEFAMAFPSARQKTIEAMLNALLLDLAQPCEVDLHRVHLDACIGMALDHDEAPAIADESGDEIAAVDVSPERPDALELVTRAQLAMHHAKRTRGRSLRRFEPGMRTEAIDRRKLDLELRRAERDGEFELHYQPQIELKSGRVAGAEALLRWRHPERGLLMPAAFLDALAISGIATTVGWWILEQACKDATTWPLVDGRPLAVSVNLFPAQFDHEDFLHEVDNALINSKLAPARLELELTETIALRNDEGCGATLQALRRRGVRVAYDDFGTGYASLSMLHHLAVDRVKIDRGFVRDVMQDRGDAAIVRSILLIARNFDLQVTAEGVESSVQAEFLRALGCNEVQGYLYSPALPALEFDQWLDSYQKARELPGSHLA
ncbi:diguanylate cyclase/phosphodiesterase [Pseudoxanthomonas sp. GM95]|uniref:putative bifunctional diguanylate cyclase/phosphodiesterase n=1 Tax=Pseudoxanthomonas sp. GM95 TaxID=1881043 RepID=UPI0008D45F16|nr:bifunctional diguanylate cyclase/phosphodiesterase [Pseudoxanthomonas sp. GM95]SEK49332.1 diguanylate cyclase/phosphodiesterase [Pseudoxanthomonas sp. GM95]